MPVRHPQGYSRSRNNPALLHGNTVRKHGKARASKDATVLCQDFPGETTGGTSDPMGWLTRRSLSTLKASRVRYREGGKRPRSITSASRSISPYSLFLIEEKCSEKDLGSLRTCGMQVRKDQPLVIPAHASQFHEQLVLSPNQPHALVSLTTNFCRRWHDEQSPPWVLLMLFSTHSFMFRFKTLVCYIPCRPCRSTAREGVSRPHSALTIRPCDRSMLDLFGCS